MACVQRQRRATSPADGRHVPLAGRSRRQWQGAVHGRRRREGQPAHLPEARARGSARQARRPVGVRRPASADGHGDQPPRAGQAPRHLGGALPRRGLRPSVPRTAAPVGRGGRPARGHVGHRGRVAQRRGRPLPAGVGPRRRDRGGARPRRGRPGGVVGRRRGAALQHPGAPARRDQPARGPRRHPPRGARRSGRHRCGGDGGPGARRCVLGRPTGADRRRPRRRRRARPRRPGCDRAVGERTAPHLHHSRCRWFPTVEPADRRSAGVVSGPARAARW